jgi:hypothetical protein
VLEAVGDDGTPLPVASHGALAELVQLLWSAAAHRGAPPLRFDATDPVPALSRALGRLGARGLVDDDLLTPGDRARVAALALAVGVEATASLVAVGPRTVAIGHDDGLDSGSDGSRAAVLPRRAAAGSALMCR